MSDQFFTRIKDAIIYFNGNQNTAASNPNSFKEFVCVLSKTDHLKMKEELIDLHFLTIGTCSFEAIPIDHALQSNFLSVNVYGVTVHFHVGEYSFIGPVISLP